MRKHRRAFPIVQIILQIAIANTKFELLKDRFVTHQIQSIKYVKSILKKNLQETMVQYFQSKNECIIDKLLEWDTCSHVVI